MNHFLALLGLLGMLTGTCFLNEPTKTDLAAGIRELAHGKDQPLEAKIAVREFDYGWGGTNRAVVLYGRGIGVYNNRTQFTLPSAQVAGLFKVLDDHKFADMPAVFGDLVANPSGKPRPAPLINGQVTVTLGDAFKTVTQNQEGPQSADLAVIARAVLNAGAKAAAQGVTADDAADGLRKVAAGELAPEVLSILLQRLQEDRPISLLPESPAPKGFLLRVEGQTVISYPDSQTVRLKPVRLKLTDRELIDLCKLLVKNEAASFDLLHDAPHAPHYTYLGINVLDRESAIRTSTHQNQPGWTPRALGEGQNRFNRVFEALDNLHRRVMKEGEPGGEW